MTNYTVNGVEFYHSGIKGMKWGVRRYQNKDGSLTPAGKKRYVTTAQAVRNANDAAKDARKKSLAESKATDSGIGSYRRAMNKASSAADEARRNSIAKDKAYNKQLREEKKAADRQTKVAKAQIKAAKEQIKAEKAKTKLQNVKDKNKAMKPADDSFGEAMKSTARAAGTGKRIGNVILNGPFGGVTYTAARAAGHSKAGAEAITIVSTLLGGPIGNAAAVAIMREEYKSNR